MHASLQVPATQGSWKLALLLQFTTPGTSVDTSKPATTSSANRHWASTGGTWPPTLNRRGAGCVWVASRCRDLPHSATRRDHNCSIPWRFLIPKAFRNQQVVGSSPIAGSI